MAPPQATNRPNTGSAGPYRRRRRTQRDWRQGRRFRWRGYSRDEKRLCGFWWRVEGRRFPECPQRRPAASAKRLDHKGSAGTGTGSRPERRSVRPASRAHAKGDRPAEDGPRPASGAGLNAAASAKQASEMKGKIDQASASRGQEQGRDSSGAGVKLTEPAAQGCQGFNRKSEGQSGRPSDFDSDRQQKAADKAAKDRLKDIELAKHLFDFAKADKGLKPIIIPDSKSPPRAAPES